MDLTDVSLDRALTSLGMTLALRGLHFEAVAIGGGTLILHGLVARTTKDLDIVATMRDGKLVRPIPLPQVFAQAVIDVARQEGLPSNWINTGPASLLDKGLPVGFAKRLHREDYGGLVMWLADRRDLIALKIYAAANTAFAGQMQYPNRHLSDLRILRPTPGETSFGATWARGLVPEAAYQRWVDQVVSDLQ